MQKLRIVPYSDDKFAEPLDKLAYTVLVNPATLDHNISYGLELAVSKYKSAGAGSGAFGGSGSALESATGALSAPDGSLGMGGIGQKKSQQTSNDGEKLRFVSSTPGKLSFSLVFDATGAIVVNGKPWKEDVNGQLMAFRVAVMEAGTPRHVRLEYGSFIFYGRLETLKTTYTLFRPDGSPLRATSEVSFVEVPNNPNVDAHLPLDATYKQLMLADAGMTIDEAATSLKGNPDAYMDVAIQNKIPHIRNLQSGTALIG